MNTAEPITLKPLRLWPGVAVAVLLVLAGYVLPLFMPRVRGLRDDRGTLVRGAHHAVVAALQPGPLVRAPRRHRSDTGRDATERRRHPSIAGGCDGNMTYIL